MKELGVGGVRWNVAGGCVVAIAMGALLAGCVPGGSAPMPVPTTSVSASSTPTPKPTQSTFLASGSAEDNKDLFDHLNDQFLFDHGMGDGRAIFDNLTAAGFPKADMELTPDLTALGIAVDALIVSVKIKDECLIGQFSATGYTGVIEPVLGTGKCLIGVTRTVDW